MTEMKNECKELSQVTGSVWSEATPKPEAQDWYWWKQQPNGVPKCLEVYRTNQSGADVWVACHIYGELDMDIMKQRWPNHQWSTDPIQRPNE